MLEHIKSQNAESAIHSLEKLTERLLNNSSAMEYIKYVYFQVINNIVCELEDIGVRPEDTEMSNTSIFDKIEKANTLSELRLFANMLMEKSVSLLADLKERKHNAMVNKAIGYINENFQKIYPLKK